MAKFPTFPTLYNEALQIHISKLKGWGYLNPEQIKSGTLNWNRNGKTTGSISIQVNTHSEQPYIELDYKHGRTSKPQSIFDLNPFKPEQGRNMVFHLPTYKEALP